MAEPTDRLSTAIYGLRTIAQISIPELNPDGVDQAAHSMRLGAVATLEALGEDVPEQRVSVAHPEERCRRCGSPNVSWSAPSPLWNAVMRNDSGIGVVEEWGELICPTCFAALAELQGVAFAWRLDAAEVRVPLAATAPDGRVWDANRWLWVDPAAASEGGESDG